MNEQDKIKKISRAMRVVRNHGARIEAYSGTKMVHIRPNAITGLKVLAAIATLKHFGFKVLKGGEIC